MKSQQQDRPIKTSCKNCAFAIYEDRSQIACAFNRISKFDKNDIIEAYDDQKEFYVINRSCNYYRSNKSNYASVDLKKVQAESALSFDVFFNYSNLTTQDCKSILNTIQNNGYYKEKLKFTCIHDYENESKVKDYVIKIWTEAGRDIIVTVCHPVDEFVKGYLSKTTNDFHLFVNENNFENIDPQLFTNINEYINTDLKRAIVINKNNILAVHNLAYKTCIKLNPDMTHKECIDNIIQQSKSTNYYVEI